MRHRKKVFTTGRRPDHARALLANQVISLIYEKRIQTTVIKAKEVRRLAEKMITLGKRGTLHHRRLAISKLHHVDAVRILFNEIAPGYMNRNGGYTRIMRLGHRRGDAAPICFLEFVEQQQAGKNRRAASVTKEVKEVESIAEAKAGKITETDAEMKKSVDKTKISEDNSPPRIKPSEDEVTSGSEDDSLLEKTQGSVKDASTTIAPVDEAATDTLEKIEVASEEQPEDKPTTKKKLDP